MRRIHKAPCYIQEDDLILVSTSAASSTCGVQLKTNHTVYTFSAYVPFGQDGSAATPVEVLVGSCDYLVEGALSTDDKQTLRQYKNKNAIDCKPSPTKPCTTGADCDQTTEYCDAINNACIVIDDPCPTPPPNGTHVDCFAAPCTIMDPCQEAVGLFTCIDDYCGGCNAIFIDANRTSNVPPPS